MTTPEEYQRRLEEDKAAADVDWTHFKSFLDKLPSIDQALLEAEDDDKP